MVTSPSHGGERTACGADYAHTNTIFASGGGVGHPFCSKVTPGTPLEGSVADQVDERLEESCREQQDGAQADQAKPRWAMAHG